MADDSEWDAISALLLPEEERLAWCAAWAPGTMVNDDVDHPCVVYLTSHAITIDIRPQTLLDKPPVVRMDTIDIARRGAEPHPGDLRLMLIARPSVDDEVFAEISDEQPNLKTFAVDLPRGREGKRFVKKIQQSLGQHRRWRPGTRA